jgi:hypothetical protein
MTDGELSDLLNQLGTHVGRVIVNDSTFERKMRAWVKEITLTALVEQEEIRAFGEVRSFLAICQAQGINLRLDRQGKVWINGKERLSSEMRVTYIRLYDRIVGHLQRLQESEERDKQRAQEAWNKAHPAASENLT